MVCCPCSNCWRKTPLQDLDGSDEEPRVPSQTSVQLAVSRKRDIIAEDEPEDDYGSIVLDSPIGNPSRKRLQLRDFSRSTTGNRLQPVVSRKPTTDRKPTPDDFRNKSVFSDWADDFDGVEDIRLSNLMRSFQRSENFSFSSDGPRTSNVPTIPGTTKMVLPPGNVLVMQLTKGDPRFRMIRLDVTLNELVETFLSERSGGVSLPVSFTESEKIRPKLLKENRMAMSIKENLGRNLDVSTQGLTFSVGPLNSKLCYKMSVVDLGQLQKIFSLTHGGKCEGLMQEEDL